MIVDSLINAAMNVVIVVAAFTLIIGLCPRERPT